MCLLGLLYIVAMYGVHGRRYISDTGRQLEFGAYVGAGIDPLRLG